jgi:DNA-binding CsgD family transcriptional regulator
MEATQLDGQGLNELKLLNDSIRQHQIQVVDLIKRRKQIILRLRKQRITYKEIANTIGVSETLIYKIIVNDIDRTPQFDENGTLIRYRGRPLMTEEERLLKAQEKLEKLNEPIIK